MLFADSVVKTDTSIIFLNKLSEKEYMKLLMAVLENTISDLSRITSIPKEELVEDYIYKHDYNVVREVLKKKHPGENFDLPTLVDMWIEHNKE